MPVLIIDDDQFYAQRISELLLDRNVASTIARNAEDALSIDLSSFDCAIVDIMLPNNATKTGITAEESRGGYLTGIAVARRLLKKKPELKIALVSSVLANADVEGWAQAQAVPFIGKNLGGEALVLALCRLNVVSGERRPSSFIVHGHDGAAVNDLKNYIQNTLKWREPIVLREQPSLGKTLIEKFEDFSGRVDYVFVLLTPDDVVVPSGSNDEKRRSRQNVIFELGFFYGSLERRSGRILLLHKGPVELPADISGVVWIDISNGISSVGEEIRKEVSPVPHVSRN